MQPIHFEESVASILRRERRYDPQAYGFLKDSLDFTLKRAEELRKTAHLPAAKNRHVGGRDLLEGFRDYALQQFGPMAATLMQEWGVRSCGDVGNMVFQMIEEQVFGKQDSDCEEDFSEIYDFEVALRLPFLPSGARVAVTAGRTARAAKV